MFQLAVPVGCSSRLFHLVHISTYSSQVPAPSSNRRFLSRVPLLGSIHGHYGADIFHHHQNASSTGSRKWSVGNEGQYIEQMDRLESVRWGRFHCIWNRF